MHEPNDTQEILEHEGIAVGPIRRPWNPGQGVQGSIHDDATAQQLGFRGGTIAGSIHMDQFPPVLIHSLGERWLETGNLSLYFLHATTHLEPVRCFAQLPKQGDADPQVEVWLEHEDGTRVCEGTASVGSPSAPSALRQRLERLRPPGELRMLAGLEPGATLEPRPARVSLESQRERLEHITESLDAYLSPDAPALPPVAAVEALRRAEAGLPQMGRAEAVGLFGAIELEHVHGPIFAEREYVASGSVLAVGETPKTEYFWYESRLDEPDGGPCVARMVMMLRFMKGSSPLWSGA
jgi:hypothetical protein